jgi:hypothetical protein
MVNRIRSGELTFSDCVMPVKRIALEPSSEAKEEPAHFDLPSGATIRNPFRSSSVTLSGLLNAIDGVASQVGPTCYHLMSLTS